MQEERRRVFTFDNRSHLNWRWRHPKSVMKENLTPLNKGLTVLTIYVLCLTVYHSLTVTVPSDDEATATHLLAGVCNIIAVLATVWLADVSNSNDDNGMRIKKKSVTDIFQLNQTNKFLREPS